MPSIARKDFFQKVVQWSHCLRSQLSRFCAFKQHAISVILYLVFTDGVPWYRGMGIKSADKNIKGERGVGRISRHHASPQNQSINPLVCEQSIANLIYEGTLRDVWICRTPVLPSVGQSSFRAFRLASISPCESRCGHAL